MDMFASVFLRNRTVSRTSAALVVFAIEVGTRTVDGSVGIYEAHRKL
jgi:hypothetical protein